MNQTLDIPIIISIITSVCTIGYTMLKIGRWSQRVEDMEKKIEEIDYVGEDTCVIKHSQLDQKIANIERLVEMTNRTVIQILIKVGGINGGVK